jgi:hypothetical protein
MSQQLQNHELKQTRSQLKNYSTIKRNIQLTSQKGNEPDKQLLDRITNAVISELNPLNN